MCQLLLTHYQCSMSVTIGVTGLRFNIAGASFESGAATADQNTAGGISEVTESSENFTFWKPENIIIL